jgi:hypothetical protein
MESLKNRWKTFCNIVFDPTALVLILLTIALAILLTYQTDTKAVAAMTLILTVLAGIVGSVLSSRWKDIVDEKVIAARANSAVRNLKHLLTGLASLDRRATLFIKRCGEEDSQRSVTTEYEEIVDRCRIIEEEVLNAIEDWTDILPEADVKTQIGVITRLNDEVESLSEKIDSLESEKDAMKGKSEDAQKRHQEVIKELTNQLKETKSELRRKSIDFGASYTGTLSTMTPPEYTPSVVGLSPTEGILVNYLGGDCEKPLCPGKRPPAALIGPWTCSECGTQNP